MVVRVAIIGCGKVADQHVQAIDRISGSSVVAVCDHELLMAKQLGERFHIPEAFADAGEMLAQTQPDVVHITTPPQSHFELARQCIEAGCHVYLEKPFTVTGAEAEALITTAQRHEVCVTAGHNYQFTPEMLEMRSLVNEGFLGGRANHIESHWSYDLDDVSYVGPLLASSDHWVRRLPGQLLHNIISHGVARLAEFLDDELVDLSCTLHQSAQLRNLGGNEVLDELRLLILDKNGTSAYFCFSTQIKPSMNQFRLCGPVNSLLVDCTSSTIVRQPGRSYKSYLTFVLPPLLSSVSQLTNAWRNGAAIFRRNLYQDAGMKQLIERFHRTVAAGEPLPIPYREILLTARIMDAVFENYSAVAAAMRFGNDVAG